MVLKSAIFCSIRLKISASSAGVMSLSSPELTKKLLPTMNLSDALELLCLLLIRINFSIPVKELSSLLTKLFAPKYFESKGKMMATFLNKQK